MDLLVKQLNLTLSIIVNAKVSIYVSDSFNVTRNQHRINTINTSSAYNSMCSI